MNGKVLEYLVSLAIIFAGVVWIVAGTIWTASDLCIAIGMVTIAVGWISFMVEFRNRAHRQNKNGAVASAVLGKGAGVFITRPGEGCDGPTGALLEDLQSPTVSR